MLTYRFYFFPFTSKVGPNDNMAPPSRAKGGAMAPVAPPCGRQWKFCVHIYQPLPSNLFNVFFENFDFERGNFEKEKNVKIFGNFEEFSKFAKSEIAVL